MTEDTVDLYRAIRGALRTGVRTGAIKSALDAVLIDETTELEAAMILRRLARSKSSRRSA
jgi:hypothetical protein